MLSKEAPPQKAATAPAAPQISHEKHGKDKSDKTATTARVPALQLTLEKDRRRLLPTTQGLHRPHPLNRSMSARESKSLLSV